MSDFEKIEQQERATFENIGKALLVGVHMSGSDTETCRDHLKELAELAKTLGVEEVREVYCLLKKSLQQRISAQGK